MTIKVPEGKYIDPLVDFAFKKIFGSAPNKDLLIAFLNEALRGHKHIIDLVYNQNEHPGDVQTEGGAIFDLLCTGDQGEQFLIEVQRGKQETFKQRALFYTSRLISSQAPKGARNDWKFRLKDVYMIALLDGFVLEDSPADAFIQDIYLCNKDTGKVFYDKLAFTYIELLKFDKKEKDLKTELDKWLYVLKNISRMNKLPVYLRKTIFEKLFNIAEYSKFTKEEKTMYDISQKRRWDNQAVLDTAINEGHKEGFKEAQIDMASRMKKEKIPVKKIAAITLLSLKEILAIEI